MGEYLSLIYYLFIINDSMTITTIIIIHYLFIYSLFLFNSYLFNIPGAMLSQTSLEKKSFFCFFFPSTAEMSCEVLKADLWIMF